MLRKIKWKTSGPISVFARRRFAVPEAARPDAAEKGDKAPGTGPRFAVGFVRTVA